MATPRQIVSNTAAAMISQNAIAAIYYSPRDGITVEVLVTKRCRFVCCAVATVQRAL
jgi:hypothetical protein